MSGIRWIVLAIVVVASSVAYVLRTNMSIVGESMITDLGMTEVQLGMLFSAFAAGYALFQIPGGMFGDKFGARFTISAMAVTWAALTVFTALVPGSDVWSVGTIVFSLVIIRFLMGVVQAPFFPVTIGGTVANWFPVSQWGLPNGLSSTGLTLGAAATAPLLVWLMESWGWRGALLITAPVGAIIGAVYYWYITNDPEDHPHISRKELDFIKADRPADEGHQEKGAWLKILKNRNVLMMTVSYFMSGYVFFLFFNWFYYYMVEVKGFSAEEAGFLTAAMWVLGAVGATAGGWICDYLVRRFSVQRGPRMMMLVSLPLAAVFLSVGAMSDNAMLSIVSLCLCFSFTQVIEAPSWVAMMAVSEKHAAVATGVLNTGGNLPGIVGGMLVPFTAAWIGWPAAMLTGSLFAIVAAVLWIFIRVESLDD